MDVLKVLRLEVLGLHRYNQAKIMILNLDTVIILFFKTILLTNPVFSRSSTKSCLKLLTVWTS